MLIDPGYQDGLADRTKRENIRRRRSILALCVLSRAPLNDASAWPGGWPLMVSPERLLELSRSII
jgi:hypothetical protein